MANMIVLFLTMLAIFGCGANLPVTIKPARNPQATPVDPRPGAATYLEGKWTDSDRSKVDLSDFRDKPTILIFAQDTCAVCRKESLAILASLAHPSAAPDKINLFTIIVGSPVEDAKDWKEALKIPWKVGADPKSELFRQYCAVPTVPCVIVQLPKRGLVLQKNGAVGHSELTSLTGPWEGP